MSGASQFSVHKDFENLIDKVSKIVHKLSGNKLGEKQAYMVETRVKKRMMELGIQKPDDYISFIEKNIEKESSVLVGLLTTHHTFFFREFPHFEILKKILPELAATAKKRPDRCIKIWSAACSRGQEVYSLAMFLEHHLPHVDPSVSYKILGTDIDPESVKIAQNGVYNQSEIKEIPLHYLGNNWAKGTGEIAMYAKVKNSLRDKCDFKVGNLLNVQEAVRGQVFDVVFCRNVFIYFEPHQIEQICKDIFKFMHPGSVFFSGISESLSGLKLDISSVGPSVYMFKTEVEKAKTVQDIKRAPEVKDGRAHAFVPDLTPEVFKVMCVDDSGSILTLLKKILSKEHGFEVVATAVNGKDAMEKLKTTKVDLVTLDIHMPEMDGITYLQKNWSKSHPPVVMITSVSREDSDVALKALKFGASDYVEKPALNNMEERGEEIRTKLRSVARDLYGSKAAISSVDKEFSKHTEIKNAKDKMRIVFASISDMPKIKKMMAEFVQPQPPTLILFEGHGEIVEAYSKEMAKEFTKKVSYVDSAIEFKENEIYFGDFKKVYPQLLDKNAKKPCSMIVYGMMSKHMANDLLKWNNAHLLLEDLGKKEMAKHPLADVAADIVPPTSFAYMSTHFLGSK